MLFADCRNYTGLTHELGVEKVGPVVDSFFRTAYDIVVKHDGIVDKFLGDALMALFNVPARLEGHVERAVAAAMELQLAIARMNAAMSGERILQLGVGIGTGFALAGRIGSDKPSDYTAIGEVINIAARLQGQAAPGEVLVTEPVYDIVRSAFPNAARNQYQLKGIPDPVAAYVLT